MKYQKYLWKPKNWNILKTASKNEHYCQIASKVFPHEKTLKFFADWACHSVPLTDNHCTICYKQYS